MAGSLFVLAIVAFGLGLSLLTYRFFALMLGWPMGVPHREWPAVPILLGLFSLLAAVVFAVEQTSALTGWGVVVCGLLLAAFWTGFLRVGSQVSLFIGPLAAGALLALWLGAAS